MLTNDSSLQDRIYGKHGTLEMASDLRLAFNGQFGPEFQEKNGGFSEVHVAAEKGPDHKGYFLNAIRSKGRVNCNAELGCATMVAIKLAVDSYRNRKTMLWDSHKLKGVAS